MLNTAVRSTKRMSGTRVKWTFDWSKWNPTESEFLRAVSCLQLDEKERIGKFVFRKDVRSSMAGRLMMRKFINEYCNLPYDKIVLTRDSNNKPILSNEMMKKCPNFNVSHQGRYTVLAGVSNDVELGIDIMKLDYSGGKPINEFFRIMKRNFTDNEWKEIKGIPGTKESDQISMFCRHWALKESYVKAIGLGIVVGLGTLDFRTSSKLSVGEFSHDTSLWIDGVRQNWHFEETLIDDEHCVAIAARGKNNDEITVISGEFEKLNFHELMLNAIPLYPEDHQFMRKYFDKAEKP